MGEAVKEAYSDLFLIKSHPKESDKNLIEGKFKSTHNDKDRPAELMAKTFFGLLAISDINHSPKATVKVEKLQKLMMETRNPHKLNQNQYCKFLCLVFNQVYITIYRFIFQPQKTLRYITQYSNR